MAIYHLSAKTISRNKGRSAVASAAYRSGENIKNEFDGLTHKYAGRKDVQYSEILLPDNAPEQWKQRAVLWNTVERVEKRKDAQTAREVEVALPIEVSRKEQIEILRNFCQQEFVSKGMVADINLHDKGEGNPHAHIMLTTRNVENGEFGKKNRSWNDKALLLEWRKNWAEACNAYLEEELKIDHRSYKDQGKEQIPTIHEGPEAMAIERRGEVSERGERNRMIRRINRINEAAKEKMSEIQELQRPYKGISEQFLGYLDTELFEEYTTKGSFETESSCLRVFESREDMLSRRQIYKILQNTDCFEESWVCFEGLDKEKVLDYLAEHPEIETVIYSTKSTPESEEKIRDISRSAVDNDPERDLTFYTDSGLKRWEKGGWEDVLEHFVESRTPQFQQYSDYDLDYEPDYDYEEGYGGMSMER